MGTRVRVVAGYRAFSAFILLRRGKASGVYFFLFFVPPFIYLFIFFLKKKFRVAQISRQMPTYRGKKFCTFGNGRLAKCAATKYVGLTCDGKIPPIGVVSTCIYEKQKKQDFKNT